MRYKLIQSFEAYPISIFYFSILPYDEKNTMLKHSVSPDILKITLPVLYLISKEQIIELSKENSQFIIKIFYDSDSSTGTIRGFKSFMYRLGYLLIDEYNQDEITYLTFKSKYIDNDINKIRQDRFWYRDKTDDPYNFTEPTILYSDKCRDKLKEYSSVDMEKVPEDIKIEYIPLSSKVLVHY